MPMFNIQILEYLKLHEGQSLDLHVRGNLWIMGQRGHLNLMKPLDISLQARNLSVECIMYLRCLSSILFFLQKSIEFSKMLLLLKIYFSLFCMIYLLVINIYYTKNQPNFKFGFFYNSFINVLHFHIVYAVKEFPYFRNN